MSWITQNKFLAGFAAAMAVGVGALGYLTYSAMDHHSSANENYESALSELKRLQGGHPYPEKANRDKIVALKTAYQEKIAAFQKVLADAAPPVEPLTPTEFQDKLKETVARISEKAAGDAKVTLQQKAGEKFYMGFHEYASGTPDKSQVSLLSRELAAFESIMNLILAAKEVTLLDLSRVKAKEAVIPTNTTNKNAAKEKPERKLLQHTNFTLKFESSDTAFRNILNGIAGNKEHFFIVRRIGIKNTKPEAPEKKQETATPTSAPNAPKDAQRLEYIFGTERVVVEMEVELVNFAKPEESAAKKPDAAPVKASNTPKTEKPAKADVKPKEVK